MNSFTQSLLSIPTLPAKCIWSDSIFYKFIPDEATWDTDVATIIFRNHGMVTGDLITLESSVEDSGWTATDEAITVVDKDTFTFPLVSVDPLPTFPMVQPYGSASLTEVLTISCKNYTNLTFRASALQVEELPSGMTITIQAKLHEDASWVDVDTVADSDGNEIIILEYVYNFIRGTITAGTGAPIVFAQYI